MLAGVLTVLKIIGIVLLVILAIILLLVLLVLFVPVRYKADILVPETDLENGFDAEKLNIKAGFSWLLHFISGRIEFPENKEFTVRVLGIKVFPRKEKPKASDDKKKKKETKAEEKPEEITEVSDSSAGMSGNSEISDNKNQDTESDKENAPESDNNINSSEDFSDESDSNCIDNSDNEPEKKNLIEIVTDIFEKIENILKTPQTVLQKIQYTISRVCDKIGMIKTTLENDIFKRAFSLVKRKFIRILKMILPDKIRAKILFGTGDPADTAEVLALYSAFYPKLYKSIQFEPDFDRKVIMADAHVKGHITMFTILYCVAVCYFNKDVKKTIKRFQKIIKS